MASFNIEDSAFAGVSLLGRRPVAALVWAVLWAGLVALVTLPFVGVLADFITLVVRSGPQPDPNAVLPLIGGLGAFALLGGIFSLALGAVISCAVYRAILTPDDSAFAYLRLGEREILVLLVNFVKAVILAVASFAMGIVLAIFMFAAMAGGQGAGMAINLIGRIVVQGVIFWLQLRLCLAGPMTFTEGRFRLFESWAATRGLTLRLLVVGIILALIVLVVYLALVTLGALVGVGLWNSAPRPADIRSLLAQPSSVWMPALAPFITLGVVLVTVGGAILTPILNAPWAHIYRTLAGGGADTAETFS
jgi:hypothetical protein